MAQETKPNRRGARSRERILDAAERIMAADGYEAAALSRIVEESEIPISSLYHYFGSKEWVLLAVMERGAERFFELVPEADTLIEDPHTHLSRMVENVCDALEQESDFLRLVVVMSAQPPVDERMRAQEVVGRVRDMALTRLRRQFEVVFGVKRNSSAARDLARFALASIDGAFIARQADPEVRLKDVLRPLPAALVALNK